jgi:hypothetical protein
VDRVDPGRRESAEAALEEAYKPKREDDRYRYGDVLEKADL